MIPRAHVTAWRREAPWATDAQVEQDLVLSRALVELFPHPPLAKALAFRGGTALHKLFFVPASRYSEDIDLVQVDAGAVGPILDAVRHVLNPWLGAPKSSAAVASASLVYRFETTARPVQQMRVKIEINTREHFAVLGYRTRQFKVSNPWFSGSAAINTYELAELLATKLRALYQRRKGRDLYDLWLGLGRDDVRDDQVQECFERYMKASGAAVSRAQFEKSLAGKLDSQVFVDDLAPLIRDADKYDVRRAADVVRTRLIARLKGKPWKASRPSPPSETGGAM